jgi:large subunit ribosomal protein L23
MNPRKPEREPRDVIVRPMITEKGTVLKEVQNKFYFVVATDATKPEIKRSIETAFNVEVESVRTMNQHGKEKRLGRFSGKRPDWKKAIVKLKAGQTIELFENM